MEKKNRISDRQMLNHALIYRSVLTIVNEPKNLKLESKMLFGEQIFSVQCVTEV